MSAEHSKGKDRKAEDSVEIDEYDACVEELTTAMERLKQRRAPGWGRDLAPAVIDFCVMVCWQRGGEQAVRAAMVRMTGRIDDWHAGRFPVDDAEGEPR